MQVKTTVSDINTPNRMAKIKRTYHMKCQQGCRAIRTLKHHWWQCKMVQPLWKTMMETMENKERNDPAISVLDIYSRDIKAYAHMKT